ncbi:hypothetical protein AAFF_G00146730 [Aldrovandia affinis]|uniref:Uncharacterized protein n=1 Tax=Aldrovandia affinis TaxID=143900 RepID=A0AAD7RPS1_9TELE|nr:hypothetical protein AAFF_G00146730 [Aldrovandia affinis]
MVRLEEFWERGMTRVSAADQRTLCQCPSRRATGAPGLAPHPAHAAQYRSQCPGSVRQSQEAPRKHLARGPSLARGPTSLIQLIIKELFTFRLLLNRRACRLPLPLDAKRAKIENGSQYGRPAVAGILCVSLRCFDCDGVAERPTPPPPWSQTLRPVRHAGACRFTAVA